MKVNSNRYLADHVVGLKDGRKVFDGATVDLTDSLVDAVYGPSD